MYAIIEDSGSQIKVSQGDIIKVALRQTPSETPTITFDRVLLVSAGEGEPGRIGTPLVKGATVVGEVLSQERTDKVHVVRFARRKNVLRWNSHRQDYLKVKITQING